MLRTVVIPGLLVAGLGLGLAACGHNTEQKAATGAAAGLVVGGPVGAAVGGAAGAVAGSQQEKDKPHH